MKSAAIYTRLSQVRPGDRAISLETQEADCRACAKGLGYGRVEVFTEAGKSASAYANGDRPVWSELLRRLESFDAVFAWKQDRMTRTEEDWFAFVRKAGVAGTRIVTVSDGTDIDPDDPELLAPGMKAVVAAQESRNASKRVRRAMAARAARGDANGGFRRYGYRRGTEPGTLVVVPEEAAVIREAAARVMAGEGLSPIAVDLQQRGVPSVRGGLWRASSLRGVLMGPTITGRRSAESEPRWEPILDDEAAAEVHARLAPETRGVVAAPGVRLLRGYARCGRCGAALAGSTRYRNGTQGYACKSAAELGCGGTTIGAEPLDAYVRDQVLALAATPAVRKAMEATGDHADELATLNKELTKLERAADRVARELGTGNMTAKAYRAASAANEAARAEAQSRVAALLVGKNPILADAPRTEDALRRWWDDGDDVHRRALLDACISQVVIGPGRRGPRGFQADRVGIVWRS
jgi:site-specific DNA recombinase